MNECLEDIISIVGIGNVDEKKINQTVFGLIVDLKWKKKER